GRGQGEGLRPPLIAQRVRAVAPALTLTLSRRRQRVRDPTGLLERRPGSLRSLWRADRRGDKCGLRLRLSRSSGTADGRRAITHRASHIAGYSGTQCGRRIMSERNASIILKAYDDFAQGNVAAVFAAFDPTIVWHVPGHSPLSGDFT